MQSCSQSFGLLQEKKQSPVMSEVGEGTQPRAARHQSLTSHWALKWMS